MRNRIDDAGAIALTFDDGPHPAGTPAMLEILRDTGARATFFLVGEQIVRYPTLAREIVDGGHDVALHCFRHRNLLRLTPRQVRDDLARAEDAIVEATGRAPLWYRPPYGVLSSTALVIVRQAGWRTILWSRWGRDWRRRASAASIAHDVSSEVSSGDVLLLHDADYYSAPGSWRRTLAALPTVLARIEGAGLTTAPLG